MRGYCEHYVSKFGLLFHQQEIILGPPFVLKHNSSLTVTKMWHWSALHLSIFFELSFNYFRKLQKVLNIKFSNEKRGLLKCLKNCYYTINFWIHRGLKKCLKWKTKCLYTTFGQMIILWLWRQNIEREGEESGQLNPDISNFYFYFLFFSWMALQLKNALLILEISLCK